MQFLVQDVMIREGMNIPDDIIVFTQEDMRNGDFQFDGTNGSFYVFSSIQMANYINVPLKNQGNHLWVEYSRDFEGSYFKHHVWSSKIEPSHMLSDTCIYLPFGRLNEVSDQIRMLFGDKLFIKPDSGAKSFTGFSCTIDELAFETMALRQTAHVYGHEMCMVTRHRDISTTEYRVWIVDGKPTTSACYGWSDDIDNVVPEKVLTLAVMIGKSEFANELTRTFVADFCMVDDQPRLIELNAMATSGWYDGMDIEALREAIHKRQPSN